VKSKFTGSVGRMIKKMEPKELIQLQRSQQSFISSQVGMKTSSPPKRKAGAGNGSEMRNSETKSTGSGNLKSINESSNIQNSSQKNEKQR